MPATDKTLDDLFEDTLRDIYYAERQITKALPKMAKAAQSPDLKAGFEKHLQETDGMSSASSKSSKSSGSRPAERPAMPSSVSLKRANPSSMSSGAPRPLMQA